ncbi:hypothetical protein DRP53_09080 [candidate division WOR-3 bacterium]|uniref:Prepilin-type N-terminal cleavage/methylation domain-containing protein n=1 Tax=candidate division WOR-3 bacterium TaxID=2052148 RepID=A0A660SEE2_UNCW3|nr:MAG: hypothetical protein DRP53_09080 [candidate division WOR-3 bacterium]
MKRGFTLIEMMVVIVVMGLLLAMVVPVVSRTFYTRSQSVNQVYTLLQRARFRAISRLTTCRVELDGNNDAVSLWDGGVRVEGPYPLSPETDLRPDVVTWIWFYSDGTADDGGGNPPPPVQVHYGKNLVAFKTIRVYQASGIPVIQ